MSYMELFSATNAHRNISQWYDEEQPLVSVIILNYNKADLTLQCLECLWNNTVGVKYEIIVVDNGSSVEQFEKLAHRPGAYRLVRLPVNRYFGEGNNIGAQEAKGKLLCFLNNDAFVTADWLAPLCDVLDNAWSAGGVGPQFIYPDGRLQEVGAFVDENGYSYQVGKFALYESSDVSHVRIVDYCSAACLLVRKPDFELVGGFDLVFEPAYYEDVDLCFKIASRGKFIYCCPQSVVVHIENATTATHRNVLGHQTVEINRQVFTRRWSDFLNARAANLEHPISATAVSSWTPLNASHTGKRLKVAFYSPFDLTPGGGERYILTAAAALTELADVYLVTEHPYSQVRLAALSRELSLDLSGIVLISRACLSTIPPIDICVILSNEILPPIKGFGARNIFICQFPFPLSDADLTARWENLSVIDEIIVYSEFVRTWVTRELRNVSWHSIPITVLEPPVAQVVVSETITRSARPMMALLVGRFFAGGHNKRHDVAIDALKRLRRDGVDIELHLVGSVPSHTVHREHLAALRQSAEGFPVHFHPNASSDELKALLQSSMFYWHATGFGIDPNREAHKCEHFGISVLEGMSAGCVPFVVDNGGPASFVQDGKNGFTYSTIEELATKVKALIDNPSLQESLRAEARGTAMLFSESIYVDRWRKLLLTSHEIQRDKVA